MNGDRPTLPPRYADLREKLELSHDLPYSSNWSAAADFLMLIADRAIANKPEFVLECSSGLSTLVLAKCCQMNGHGKVFSLENGAEYAEKTRSHIRLQGLEQYAEVLYAPLVEQKIRGDDYSWYDLGELPDMEAGMLVIDGPPGFLQRQSRYPALPMLATRLAEDCILFLDDAARNDEKAIVSRWLQEFSGWKHTYLEAERGCSVLYRGDCGIFDPTAL